MLEDVERIGIYAADVDRGKVRDGRRGRVRSRASMVLIMGGAPGEGRRWTMNGYITGSVDVETCVITKTHFRMLDPLLVNSPFNRSTFHVK
jgi:hypothetical protein